MITDDYVKARIGEGEIVKYRVWYIQYVRDTLSINSRKHTNTALDAFFKHFPDVTSPEMLSRHDVKNYKEIRGREVKPGTLVYEVSILKTFWDWMIAFDYTAYNPWVPIRKNKFLFDQ